ncbi:MAG: DAK2 domain-containing protein [Clostridia bacterium]|nr:DAK2 domain-containing protein [Clostridia bacterium]
MLKQIDSQIFVQMLISGANNLINNKQRVDDMNVFPVPDGDTGTNMSMTMKACVEGIKANADNGIDAVAKSLANDTLRGARGNSGVILSQLMRGFKKAFEGAKVCDVKLWAKAFKSASDSAYRAVMKPTEGTILTVAREMAESAMKNASRTDDFEKFLSIITDAGNAALAKTPELLPKLKTAGVVDAGGQGLMCIVEGMHYYVCNGKIIELSESEADTSATSDVHIAEEIRFAYCTECIVDKNIKGKSALGFKTKIENIGDSMVFVDDDDLVKVHIHTNEPNIVLAEALKIGSLATVKIENMRLQHNEMINSAQQKEEIPAERTKYAFISVAVGEGIVSMLKELGVTAVIEGGQTMNPSTDDILSALEKINSDNIFVFPNNKNVIMSAQQAAKLSKKNVKVVATTSVTQSMSCMLTFDEDASFDENEAAFEDVIATVKSGQVTNAVRDTQVGDVEIKTGEYLSIAEGKIVHSCSDITEAVLNVCGAMADDDSEAITVFYGDMVSEDEAEDMAEKLEDAYPDCDIIMNSGAQPVYHYLISVE